jgi:hypothetical protein
MISLALIVVVTGHLLSVDFAMIAPLICLWLQWRGREQPAARRLDRQLLKLSLAALAAAVPLGIAAAGLVWIHCPMPYGQALAELPRRRYEFGVVELLFSAAALWLAAWLGQRQEVGGTEQNPPARWRPIVRWLTTLLASLNLIYHFPPLFVMLSVLSTRPATWGEHASFVSLLADAEVQARLAHHLLAAVVVTGTMLAWLAASGRRGAGAGADLGRVDIDHGDIGLLEADRPDTQYVVTLGARLAVAAMLLQVLSGAILVAELPTIAGQAILGQDALAAGLFAASLLATFFALPRLAATALGHVNRRHLTGSLGLVIFVMLLMTAARQRTRDLLFQAEPRVEQPRSGDGNP